MLMSWHHGVTVLATKLGLAWRLRKRGRSGACRACGRKATRLLSMTDMSSETASITHFICSVECAGIVGEEEDAAIVEGVTKAKRPPVGHDDGAPVAEVGVVRR